MTLVVGKSDTGRRSLVEAVGREHGIEFLHVDARRLDMDRAVARMQLRDCVREARLLDKRLVVCNIDALAATSDKPERFDSSTTRSRAPSSLLRIVQLRADGVAHRWSWSSSGSPRRN